MAQRFVSVWFRYLMTDWFAIRHPARREDYRKKPFVVKTSSRGRMIVAALNMVAEKQGITVGMPLTDAKAIIPELLVEEDVPDVGARLLRRLAEWCIRFSPSVAVDLPDGLVLDATGCSHLWGGDDAYIADMIRRLNDRGYHVRVAMADTLTLAWGVARYGKENLVVHSQEHFHALMALPPEALRLEPETIERLHQLGLHRVRQFINMPRASLRRRFGPHLLHQLAKALGKEEEILEPVLPADPYQERLPCLEPIVTADGIEIALKELLKALCRRLRLEQKGLRSAVLKGYRTDGKIEQVMIGTNQPSHHADHLFKLFELKLSQIEPGMGIELFILEAPGVDDLYPLQETLWEGPAGSKEVYELLDRLSNKTGASTISRYIPAEHYWPERSFRKTRSLEEPPTTSWPSGKLRPLYVFPSPEPVEVTAPIPDYPPMLFRYRNKIHKVKKADGPERIAPEWWIQSGQHRDYYRVEDEDGNRYWIFRQGHYDDDDAQWFLHGIFS